ncbi:condensation domain-containing protein [Pseudomonas aeruginosa]|nr:condensation domain-containing protein [Pseudomonas aeruginosa]
MVRFARLPLSPYQRDIWVAAAQFPELDQYTIFSYDRFTGEVDTQALERALLQAARDTEAFRLRLGETDGTPYQWLDADAEFEARHVDLRADRDPEAAVRSWLRDAFRHAYPLDGRSLVDLALLHSDQALYVYVRTHHIVSDAWGLQLFLSRVRAGYLGELGEPQAQMPTASLLAQLETDDYSGSEQYRGDRAYFAEALEGLEPALFTRRRPAGLRRTARHRLTLERTLLDAIRDRGESPFLFLSAAVALYLARIHQNDDVVLGVPVLNRADRAAKQVVGHFANTLPLRIRTAPEQTVDEFLAQLREATRTLLRHQKMPLGDLLRGASPLFDTTLSYMRWPAAQAIPNASVETVAQTHAHDPDALAIWVSEFDGHSDAQVDFEYACDVFDADFPMDAAARHIETFLRALVEGGERRLGELDPLSAAEREELIHTRNATDQAFPEQATLPTLFAEQVARTPQRTALLEADGGTLSYAELDAKVQAVADALRAAGEDRRAGSATGRPRSPPAAGDPWRAARRRRLCADQSRPSPGARPPAVGRLRRPRGAGGRARSDTRREPRRDARAAPRTPAAEHRRPAGGQRGARRPGLCHLYLRFDRHAQGRHGRAPLGGQPPELDAASLSDRRTRRASAKDSGDVRRVRLGTVLVEFHRRPPVAVAARRREGPAGNVAEHPARRGHGHPLRAVDADAVPRPARRRPDRPHGGKLAAPGVLQRRSPRAVAGRAFPPAVRRRRATGQPVRTDRGHRRRVRP